MGHAELGRKAAAFIFESEFDAMSERVTIMIIPKAEFIKYEMPGGLNREKLPPGVIPVVGASARASPPTAWPPGPRCC